MNYEHLFSPIKINNLMLPNRIIAAPANGGYSKERATSKAGLAVWGTGTINLPNAGLIGEQPYMFSKYKVQETRRTLDFMRQGGSKASLEIMHAGFNRRGDDIVGPVDDVNCEGLSVRGLKREELPIIAKEFAKTALDAKKLGFDMIMLHFAHGWLPAEFLSPAWNHRTDEYGGSYENRARFPIMILKEVRAAVGSDFPIDMRISAKEWIPNEIDFEDVLKFIKEAEPYIDMVNISAGTDMNKEGCVHMTTSQLEERLTNIEYSKIVKQNVNIPVAVVGSIFMPDEAERVISEGYADMVMLGRALIADPFWVKKVLTGREDDIVPCIRCGYCSHWASNRFNHGCSVNPRYLRGDWVSYCDGKAEVSKNVVIVGGGPAGMKAAITAFDRGHKVTLIEKRNELGGAALCSDYDITKTDLKRYKDYLIRQVDKRDIKLMIGTEATYKLIEELKPDSLIIAVGGAPFIPKIEGVENAIKATDVYPMLKEMPNKIVIIGGGTIGCELALDLDDGNRNITIVEVGEQLHKQDSLFYDIALRQHLEKAKNINIMTNTLCTRITDSAVYVELNKIEKIISADKVILAAGMKPNKDLANDLFGITVDTYTIGDCVRPAKIREATDSAYFTAINL